MKCPKGTPMHAVCPAEFRRVPNITGSFELDCVIQRNSNKDMQSRLAMYAGDPRVSGSLSYGPRTAYDGYDGYGGDE